MTHLHWVLSTSYKYLQGRSLEQKENKQKTKPLKTQPSKQLSSLRDGDNCNCGKISKQGKLCIRWRTFTLMWMKKNMWRTGKAIKGESGAKLQGKEKDYKNKT